MIQTCGWERMTDADDPRLRCDGYSSAGPCPYKRINGSKFCPRHGGNKALEAKNVESIRNYRLTRWKQRVGELADSQGIKSLREEIGILRMILEEMLEQCKDSTDLLLYSHKMSDLVLKIERLVVSCDRLENRMGLLLSKGSVLQLAQQYIEIITENITDADVIERISSRLVQVTMQIGDPTAGKINYQSEQVAKLDNFDHVSHEEIEDE
jgi:hypothetical protein